MKKILLTGGSGYIGSHTCLSLLEEGYEVLILDSLVNSNQKSIDQLKKICKNKGINIANKINFIKGDLRNKEFIDFVFQRAKNEDKPIEGVIHFAGLKAVAESQIYPLMYWDNNVKGSLNLIQSMKENDCKTIVFSSSATVYGESKEKLIKESSELKPINPYGTTKLVVENLLNDIVRVKSKGWRIAVLRYFNPIGAHYSGLIGENPLQKPNNIFPIIINSAFNNISLKIFGNDWPTKDGTCIRDYIHVMDLAEGHLKALNFLFKNESQIIKLNIGTGKGKSVLELIKTFEIVNKVKVPYEFDSRREGDAVMVVADNSKAKSILKWSPQRSLEDMCKSGWNWKCSNPNGY